MKVCEILQVTSMQLITTWQDWCTVYGQLDFWRDEIGLICAAQRVELQRVDSTFPGTHAVFYVNDDLVLKIYCPVRYNSYEKELRLHIGPLAHSRLYPRVRFHGTSPSGYDYLAFTRLSGASVREIDGKAMSTVAICELAQAIAILQRETLTEDGRCLIHYDLTEEHVYLDSAGRLQGIIDFGDAEMGHPADEFPTLFTCCLGADDARNAIFREAYAEHATHYDLTEADLVAALHRHPFCGDILTSLQRLDTRFARNMVEALGARPSWPTP